MTCPKKEVEPDIGQFLTQMYTAQIGRPPPSEFESMWNAYEHLKLEKWDKENDMKSIAKWCSNRQKIEFLTYHIKMTEPVFGKWNFTTWVMTD
jgi:hypothetical protein